MLFSGIFRLKKIIKLPLTHTLLELMSAYFSLQRAPKGNQGEFEAPVEAAFSSALYPEHNCVLLPHARIAVQRILAEWELPAGSEVLLTPLTIGDMVNSIYSNHLVPKFVDIELDTYNYDLADLERAITPRAKVLLITYLGGVVPELDKIIDFAKQHDLRIIEDCSQAIGSRYKGRLLGDFGHAAVFSFTNFKMVSSLFGGMIATRDQELANRLRSWRDQALQEPDYKLLRAHCFKNICYGILSRGILFHIFLYPLLLLLEYFAPALTYRLYSGNIRVVLGEIGQQLFTEFPKRYYTRFTAAQRDLALASIARLASVCLARQRNGNLLRSTLSAARAIALSNEPADAQSVYWRLPVLTRNLDRVKRRLLRSGFDSSRTFLCLCSNEPAFARFQRFTPKAQHFKQEALILEVSEKFSPQAMRAQAQVIVNEERSWGAISKN